ncbi:MAG: dUTP diphosphatase [Phycisphaerales bacterium]|nr:dUTP diphosphatase [Phycisphaerales bacterium]
MSVSIEIINQSKHPLPEYQTSGSAGMDLRASLAASVHLEPLERRLIPTGLFIALPQGYEAQIRPRSGLSIKRGLSLVNAVGTIDSDYRGELMIPIINLSQEQQSIEDGERIAQMVIARYEQASFTLVSQLSETERGVGGFGHSGIQ